MLVLWRFILGAALAYAVWEVRENARVHPDTGDLYNAGLLAICVGLGILNAMVWASYFGATVSAPLTSTLTDGAFIDTKNRVVRLIYWLQDRGWRRATLLLCFLEGIRRPQFPTPFVVGFKNAPPGSWFEKTYAKEVYRFNNIQNCVEAYKALRRRGIDPGPHPHPEVNLVLLSLERKPKPEPQLVEIPPAKPLPPLKRDTRIDLFESAPSLTAGRQEE